MYLPIMILLLLGMMELAKISYTYYSLQKTLATVAQYLGSQQGVNFCDDADTVVTAAKTFALTGTADGAGAPYIRNLTADQIQVRIERFSSAGGDIGECECSATGCDTTAGGQGPDYIVVSIPEGYPFPLAIPNLPTDPIILRPRVRMPYLGT